MMDWWAVRPDSEGAVESRKLRELVEKVRMSGRDLVVDIRIVLSTRIYGRRDKTACAAQLQGRLPGTRPAARGRRNGRPCFGQITVGQDESWNLAEEPHTSRRYQCHGGMKRTSSVVFEIAKDVNIHAIYYR